MFRSLEQGGDFFEPGGGGGCAAAAVPRQGSAAGDTTDEDFGEGEADEQAYQAGQCHRPYDSHRLILRRWERPGGWSATGGWGNCSAIRAVGPYHSAMPTYEEAGAAPVFGRGVRQTVL